MNSFFEEAIHQSTKSSYKYKLGAVVVYRNAIVGKGFNIAHSTGNKISDGFHAEMLAINRTTAKFRKGSTLIVGRLNKKGELALAKPCQKCENVLKKLGVKQVWYSDNKNWVKMIL